MIRQPLSEGLALLGPVNGIFEADPGEGLHHNCHGQTLIVEVVGDDQKAIALLRQQISSRHPYVIKVQGGSIAAPPALLFIEGRAANAFKVHGDNQHRNAATALAFPCVRPLSPNESSMPPEMNVLLPLTI